MANNKKIKVLKAANSWFMIAAMLIYIAMPILTLAPSVANAAVTPATNPQLGNSCGMDMVLVLDSSDSMNNSDITTVENAANTLVDALMPETPTQIGVIDFDTNVVSSLSPTSNETNVHTAINSIGHVSGTEYTNWEAALLAADAMVGSGDLVVIITDGNPTRSNGPLSDLNDAITAANTIKAGGTRILAIGINSSGSSGGLNLANLQAISGLQVIPPGTITDINLVDVYMGDISALGSVLENLTTALCGGTITAIKIIDADGILETAGDQTPGESWNFDVAGSQEVTDQTGYTQAVEVDQGTYDVSETQEQGVSFY